MTTIELRRGPSALIHSDAVRVAAGTTAAMDQPARVALVAAIASIPPITFLHLSATGGVEPAGWTISDYVVSLPYGIPLFAMTAGALAIGAVVLARGLAAVAGTRFVRALLAVWAVALLVAAIFPTNLRGTPQNFSSNVHLIAGAVVFAVLPLAGWMLARWQRRIRGGSLTTATLSAVSIVSGILSTALILNRMPGVIGMPELMLPPGILQRAAGAVEIVLLAVAAFAVLRSARRS
jgi:Protein of unknown function (DUF998)